MITAEQVTRAREILGWSIVDLARWSKVGQMAIFGFEVGTQPLPERDLIDIKAALEAAGIEFTNDDKSGVRRKRR